MSVLCPIDNPKDNNKLIICDSALAKQAHQELFCYGDDVYETDNTGVIFRAVSGVVESCNLGSTKTAKIHLVLNWQNLLQVSLWQPKKPETCDVFMLLKNAGIGSKEIQPFKDSDINDMFPWLYYGKRFDILRRLCHKAKKQMEDRIKNHSIRVDCHLIAEDMKKIVASSL